MRIDFLGIEAFVSVAERHGFQRAAADLNLSQSALSHRIAKLEADLGVKLFSRTTRQVALTPAGIELLPKARAMLETLTVSYGALRAQGRERQDRVAIGCLPTVATYYLPSILKEFCRHLPQISVRIYDNSAEEIAAMVQSGEAEFGITALSAGRWNLEMKPLLKERYVLLCPADHALAARSSVTWADFEGMPLVRISPQASNRVIIDEALGPRREFMQWRYEVQHIATAVQLVAEGVALTVVPQLAIGAAAQPGLMALPIKNPAVTRTLGLVTNPAYSPSAAGEILRDGIIRRFKAMTDTVAR